MTIENPVGIRVYWNGTQLLNSHTLQPIQTPGFFTDGFPDLPFEGTLQTNDRTLQSCTELLITENSNKWREASVVAMDAPLMWNMPYAHRWKHLSQSI
jgi:hypothetical protein